MATKLYNSHLNNIIFNSSEYFILDTYISIVHIASEVKGKYLIQTCDDSKSTLISLVKKYVKASYKTIYNCLEKLISLNIIKYTNELHSWTIVDMENMTMSKSDTLNSYEDMSKRSGYTQLRNFFFSDEFFNMKAREKRLMIYMAQLSDSKSSEFHNGFTMNLLKPNSPWLKILKTKCKYYAKYTIEKMFVKYSDIFVNKSENFREKDLSPKKNKSFKFFFNCDVIRNKATEDETIELVKLTNLSEYELIMEKIRFCEVSLTKKQVMHLIRAISNIKEWALKERVAQLIINKYRAIQIHQSREKIKSLPAYAAAVVISVLKEYNNFKAALASSSIRKYEVSEHFVEYSNVELPSTPQIDFSLL